MDSSYSIDEDGNFIEYDIISKEPGILYTNPVSKDLNLEFDGVVEPFQESQIPESKQQHAISASRATANEPAIQEESRDYRRAELSKPSEKIVKNLNEDELAQDIKSILLGNKLYDPVSKKVINKSDMVERKSQAQEMTKRPDSGEKELKPLDQKNEHEIFEKIRQSMKYANAYDLGSATIEKHFKELDEIMDIEENKKKDKLVKSGTVKNTISQPKRSLSEISSQDFIEDIDHIIKENSSISQSSTIPLDPKNVGRSIGMEALQPGDIIISTTNEKDSKIIRFATGSEISHSSIYIGNGKVIEAVSDGVLERSLETSLMDDTVAVGYRHVNMTPDKAEKLVDFLKRASESKAKYDYWSLVRVVPYQIVNNYCSSLPSNFQDRCREQARNFRIGTDLNNEFYCSEMVFKALKEVGLNISDIDPSWSSPQDIVRLNHNGTLLYVGHLKV